MIKTAIERLASLTAPRWTLDGSAAVRSVLALRLEPLIAAKAKERQLRKSDSVTPTLAEQTKGETRDEIAKLAGVSHGTIDKVKKVMTYGTDEVKQKMQSGECRKCN